MIKLVVFDMAGTVVDEQNLVYKILAKAINESGFRVTLEKVLELGAGKEKRTAIVDILSTIVTNNNNIAAHADKIFANFRVLLEEAYQTEPILPQPGTEDVFQRLREKGVKVALNTGYDSKTAHHLTNRLGWEIGQHIDALVTASDVERGRPYPDMIHLAMQQTGISNPEEVVKIGDSAIDIEEGQQANCKFSIGITTGAHTKEQLQQAQPAVILIHMAELIPFLEESEPLVDIHNHEP